MWMQAVAVHIKQSSPESVVTSLIIPCVYPRPSRVLQHVQHTQAPRPSGPVTLFTRRNSSFTSSHAPLSHSQRVAPP
jgi:hypothetical protein